MVLRTTSEKRLPLNHILQTCKLPQSPIYSLLPWFGLDRNLIYLSSPFSFPLHQCLLLYQLLPISIKICPSSSKIKVTNNRYYLLVLLSTFTSTISANLHRNRGRYCHHHPISQMREVRHKEVRGLTQGLTDSEWELQNPEPVP